MRRALHALSLAAIAAGVGCAALAGLDKDYALGETGGGGHGGSGGSGGGGAMECALATPPSPPGIEDDGGTIDFVSALRKIELDEKAPDVTMGLDLDGLCTCEGGALGSCTTVAELVCDGPDGIDNAVGIIFAGVYDLSSGAITSGQLSGAANNGEWTQLLRVRGYNGAPDDASVEVLAYSTQGVAAGMPEPVWDGNDAWPIDEDSLSDPANPDTADIVSKEAYVSGGVLVAKLAFLDLHIRSDLFRMDMHFTDVVLQATLSEKGPGQYDLLQGVVAGHWPIATAFADLASIRYSLGKKLCIGDPNYLGVRSTICSNLDVRADHTEGPCDSLSFGAKIETGAAKLGPVVPPAAPLADPCSPEVDPANDTCD